MLVDGCLTRGYAISDAYKHGEDYEWVCEDCFKELSAAMEWKTLE